MCTSPPEKQRLGNVSEPVGNNAKMKQKGKDAKCFTE